MSATVACAALCACAAEPRRVDSIDVPLTAAPINAGETGRATLIAQGGRTQVTVVVSGVPAQLASRPVHLYTYLYAGACGSLAPGPAFALTERVLADSPSGASGRGPLTITNVAPASLESFESGRYAIRVMTSPADGNREIFCGNVR